MTLRQKWSEGKTKTLAVFIGGFMLGMTAQSLISGGVASATPVDPHKVLVCKYVGTPGVDERLQTGPNPIVVDEASVASLTADIFNETGIAGSREAFAQAFTALAKESA